MFYPSKPDILRLNLPKGYLIPLCKRIETDESQAELYEKARSAYSFLLDSAKTHPKTGRYSFFGTRPIMSFSAKASHLCIETEAGRREFFGDPIAELRKLLERFRSVKFEGMPSFTGGAVGYFSYDCCHLFEKLPQTATDDLNLPDIYFMFFDTIMAFDHLKNEAMIISNIYPDKPLDEAYDEAVERIRHCEETLQTYEVCSYKPRRFVEKKGLTQFSNSTFTKAGFERVVRRAKKYIKAGDIFQANLSQRLSHPVAGIEPFEIYKVLREINPSPFACFLDFGDLQIASSSPERLIRSEGRFVETRPIAGTRPRGKTASEDLALSCELLLSDKERAEHIMLVDLERNDLGRVCVYGTVRVDELMVLEEYSHVIHIVSNVIGRLKRDKDRFDLLAASFPGGTITGTPKIRCMEIIDELEPVTRNIYTGSIGYLGFNGDMDLNIVIRTFVIKNSMAHVQVGAGIVADSDPTREYYETLYKAEALLKTMERLGVGNDALL